MEDQGSSNALGTNNEDPAELPRDGCSSRDACLAFFATTMAALATLLAQVADFQLEDSSAASFLFVRDTSTATFIRRRRNAVSFTYMKILYTLLVLYNQQNIRVPREITGEWYIKPRARQWFVMFLNALPQLDPERFKQFFRISPTLFARVCELVNDDLATDPPESFRVLPNRLMIVQRQVALALRRLCTGDHYLGIAELFGVSKSTAVKVTWRFIKAFNQRARHYIRWPTGARLEEVKARFLDRSGIPNCCGAIDGTHFPVELPAGEQSADYFDYKHNMSVSMQAIVDTELRFLDVVAGWPGSIQDSRLLRNSRFFESVVYRQQRLQGQAYICPNGSRIREHILGDSGYPLYEWLIVPFPRGMNQANDQWNHIHSSTRMCVERAFGRLKGTWRILSRILFKPKMDRIGPMIYTCCLLHNMIIESRELLNPAIYEGFQAHPNGYGGLGIPHQGRFEGGLEAREIIRVETLRQRLM